MYLKDLPIEKQLEYCTTNAKVKLVKYLFKKHKFDFESVNVIYQRLRRYIKNHPDLPNIDDYIQIRREFIYVLEPDLFISKEEFNKKRSVRKCINIIKINVLNRAWYRLKCISDKN